MDATQQQIVDQIVETFERYQLVPTPKTLWRWAGGRVVGVCALGAVIYGREANDGVVPSIDLLGSSPAYYDLFDGRLPQLMDRKLTGIADGFNGGGPQMRVWVRAEDLPVYDDGYAIGEAVRLTLAARGFRPDEWTAGWTEAVRIAEAESCLVVEPITTTPGALTDPIPSLV